ncbi:MFS transporter small subunit [Streptomyces prasinus]
MSGKSSTSPPEAPAAGPDRRGLIVFAWLWVGLPLAYGLYELVRKAAQLFTG